MDHTEQIIKHAPQVSVVLNESPSCTSCTSTCWYKQLQSVGDWSTQAAQLGHPGPPLVPDRPHLDQGRVLVEATYTSQEVEHYVNLKRQQPPSKATRKTGMARDVACGCVLHEACVYTEQCVQLNALERNVAAVEGCCFKLRLNRIRNLSVAILAAMKWHTQLSSALQML